jgi:long-subunit acyl-CoA synthetase (AMP-forming)
MHVERGKSISTWTWTEYLKDVTDFAKAMHVVGVNERKAVNIMGHNAPEWAISFLGALFYNCVASGVYSTNLPDAVLYQAEHSDAELLVVDSIA